MSAAAPLLSLRAIEKSFGRARVVRGVDLDVRAGEVHALAGENGAGKSTLMKIAAGIHQPDAGTIAIDGAEAAVGSPARARELGVALVHQELALAPNLTVAENLALGREPRRGGQLDRGALAGDGRAALARVGADFPAARRVERLSTGEQQLVEIARALSHEPRVLILDEPTASLSEREARRLFEIVRGLRADGLAIVYITHRMEEIQLLADRVTVMRDGERIATLEREQATPDAIVERMVGRPLAALYEHEERPPGAVLLRARGVGDGRRIGPVDLELRAGEIAGIGGLIGAGRSELLRLLYGADPLRSGVVELDGRPLRLRGPADAIAAGIALVPESRKEQGLLLDLSVAQNIALASAGGARFSRGGVLRRRAIAAAAREHAAALDLKARSVDQPVGALSGGNQQKVLLAKCLELRPRVLLLDEPTRGVDVGAKAEIYKLMGQIAAQGVAVLFVSSELPELLGMSHRVLVMRAGRIAAELAGAQASEEDVMRYATGATASEAA